MENHGATMCHFSIEVIDRQYGCFTGSDFKLAARPKSCRIKLWDFT